MYPELPTEKFHVITNGYDDLDFRGVQPRLFEKFTILFTGYVYQVPYFQLLLKAFRAAMKKNPAMETQAQVLFIGQAYQGFPDLIEQLGLAKQVKLLPYVQHRAAIEAMMGAHVLFFDSMSLKEIRGKLFEYLRSGSSILGILPRGHVAAKIIHEAQAGEVFWEEEQEPVQRKIEELFTAYQVSGTHTKRDWNHPGVLRYERRHLTEQLVDVFDKARVDHSKPAQGGRP